MPRSLFSIHLPPSGPMPGLVCVLLALQGVPPHQQPWAGNSLTSQPALYPRLGAWLQEEIPGMVPNSQGMLHCTGVMQPPLPGWKWVWLDGSRLAAVLAVFNCLWLLQELFSQQCLEALWEGHPLESRGEGRVMVGSVWHHWGSQERPLPYVTQNQASGSVCMCLCGPRWTLDGSLVWP